MEEGFFADYQFGYGLPGGFNPFLLNPGWLDAAYMYAWPDYFRTRQPGFVQQSGVHPGLVKGKNYQRFKLNHMQKPPMLSNFI